MSYPLRSLEDYELFIYSLPENYQEIRWSSLAVVRVGATLAKVTGEIHFDDGFRLLVRERLASSQ